MFLPIDSGTILVKCWPTGIIMPIPLYPSIKTLEMLLLTSQTSPASNWRIVIYIYICILIAAGKCARLNLALTHKNNNCFDKARSTFQDGTRMDTWLVTRVGSSSSWWEAPAVLVGEILNSKLIKDLKDPYSQKDSWSVSLSQEWHGYS